MSPLPGAGRTVAIGAVRFAELCAAGYQQLLGAGFRVVMNETTVPWGPEDLAPRLADADAAVSGVEVYDQTMFARSPRLRVIARLGVGLDNIDLIGAREHGVAVTNAPGGNAAAVGELALGLILSVLRSIPTQDRDLRSGRWDRYVGNELGDKAVGLVGFGATARVLATRLQGFGVRLLAFDPYADATLAGRLNTELASLEDLLAVADIVSLHAPHTPATHHLIDAQALGRMKPGAILVNTGRGGLVDEAALIEALTAGRLAGAGLDVFEVEPLPIDSPLLRLGNVVVTPHGAADSWEAYDRIGRTCAQAIIDVFEGRRPAHLAN